ncbi:Uncharacterised protein [Legionella busanensis]|uniref:Uncharacterized protein n=1 Tax=Legionella busanensis TaxID=190655 RepID=A0A378JN92_9GAMM|nr:hypothetical protein [Legionella busanensis]STX51753.1 Uncharacterised protein [Legionella busanensis]
MQLQFLSDVKQLPAVMLDKALDSEQFTWNSINFARCLKGLKKLPVISPLQAVLQALTIKLNQS